MDKKNIVLLFGILVFLSLVSAQPPPREIITNEGGFQVTYNERVVLKQNESIQFSFHVFNITSGQFVVSGIDCYFHLYNITGNHIYTAEGSTTNDNFDYEFQVDGGNFTQLGEMSYIMQCNNTEFGGFIRVPLFVTKTGFILETSEAIIYVLFIGILVMVLALCMTGALVIPWKNPVDAVGKVIDVNELRYAKIILWAFTYIIGLFLARFMMFLSENWLLLANFWVIFKVIYAILWALLFPIMVFSIVLAIVNYLSQLKIKEQIFRNLT